MAYKDGEYQKALDAWYNALLMRKDDPDLVAKISDTENKLRKQEVETSMRQALEFYNKGQYVEAYAVFERITKIQPGDARVQKYMSQLKNEIAAGYYNAGNRSYNSNRFDQAISYWNNAKKWGADSSSMDSLIKRARNAKENHLRVKKEEEVRAQEVAKIAEEKAKAAEEAAEKEAEQEELETIETVTVDGNVPGMVGGSVIPGAIPGSSVGAVGGLESSEALPTMGGTMTRVSAEASAASRAKYIEGLDAFNQDDYERARQAWIMAKQLDPGNSDADLGLRKVEELMK